MSDPAGVVYLVGAGPGDPGLITVRGLALLRSADVVVFDRLVDRRALACTRPGAELINVGKTPSKLGISQEEINAILINRARRGLSVVRLKGGDPFVFGRGFEELTACREAGVACLVVPGVTSALAAPAAAGIPVTQRGVARSIAIVTGSTAEEGATPPLDYEAFARIDTVIVLMGRANLEEITRSWIVAGRDSKTPVACVESATTRRQRTVTGTLETIAKNAVQAGITAPMITVIGRVAAEAVVGNESLVPLTTIAGEAVSLDSAPVQNVPRALAGRRIVITRPRTRSRELRQALLACGATVIDCPLTRIAYPQQVPGLDAALRRIGEYDWIVFTSAHGVQGFWRRLISSNGDARAFSRSRLAAVGPATVQALKRCGLRADLVPPVPQAASLVESMILSAEKGGLGRVLFSRGDLAGPTLANGLGRAGATVDEVVVYQNVPLTPSRKTLEDMAQGIDAVVFHSPSAVGRFRELKLGLGDAVAVCIGPITAAAARESGFVTIESSTPDVRGIISALA